MVEGVLPGGERVTIVAYAESVEFCGTPFDKGRSVYPIEGNPRKGEKMALCRFFNERREWWPLRKVRTEREERIAGAVTDFMERNQWRGGK